MARYESDAVGFAEKQFEGLRQREDKRAQQQKKREDKLLLLKTAAKGANALINQRADQLEANQAHIKAAYQSHIGKAEQIKELEAQINKSGRTATDFFQNSYYGTLTEQAAKEAKEQGLALTQQNFTLLRQKAHDMAREKADAFKGAVIQANDLPSLEDFKLNWEKHSKLQAPRTIFGAMSKQALNFFKKETPETLAYKEGKAKDALFKTPLKNEFTEFETIYKTYDALGFDATPVLNALDKQDKRKKIKSTQMISTRDYKNAKGGYVPLITTVHTEYEDGTYELEKLDIQNSEIIDNQMVKPDEISKFVDTLQPSVRGDFLKDIEKLNGFVTIQDYISLVARRAREDAKLSNVDEITKVSDELRETWTNHLTTLILDEQTMKEYGLTAESGHIKNTPLYEKNIETGELSPKLEYAFILKDKGLDWYSWREKGFDESDIDLVKDPQTPEGEEIVTNFKELKGFINTTIKITPQDFEIGNNEESPLSMFANIPVKNGFQTAKVSNVGLYLNHLLPSSSALSSGPGTIKINHKTNEISYQLEETATATKIKNVVQTNTNSTPTVKSSNDFNLSDEDFDELVASAKPFSTMPNLNILSVPKLNQIVRNVSTQTLIDKGYLENKAKARVSYIVRKARKKYKEDLLQAIKDARETGKQTITASL